MLKTFLVDNFRSHEHLQVKLGPLTIIHGPNGAGKTNLIEALWMLATTRSFRTVRDSTVVRWGAEAARVVADSFELVVVRSPSPAKIMRIRGVIRNGIDYLGELRAVLFLPESFRILLGGPEERRRFFDTILAQQDRVVARLLLTYRRIVRQRNQLLLAIAQGNARETELDPWDKQLIETGVAITSARRVLVEQLAAPFMAHHHELGPERSRPVGLTYQPAASEDPAEYQARLLAARPRELALGVTLVGPHRDDLVITLDGRPAADHGSRGELRRILVALKWAEVDLYTRNNALILLLLDDVFSEFDAAARAAVLKLPRKVQTILTTTDLTFLAGDRPADAVLVALPPATSQ